jgi:hypothetical protein
MSITLSSALPADDRNGLGAIASAMLDDPEGVHFAVVVIGCKTITTKVESGDVVPTACILAIEAFRGDTPDAAEVRRLWHGAYEHRTGKVQLPFSEPDDATASRDDD